MATLRKSPACLILSRRLCSEVPDPIGQTDPVFTPADSSYATKSVSLAIRKTQHCVPEGEMEAAIGIEPMDKGFADLCLTTWLRRLDSETKGEGCLAQGA